MTSVFPLVYLLLNCMLFNCNNSHLPNNLLEIWSRHNQKLFRRDVFLFLRLFRHEIMSPYWFNNPTVFHFYVGYYVFIPDNLVSLDHYAGIRPLQIPIIHQQEAAVFVIKVIAVTDEPSIPTVDGHTK